ncbi:MAG: hypothetical protein ACM338_00030 [Betaproteobacteria bacterium]
MRRQTLSGAAARCVYAVSQPDNHDESVPTINVTRGALAATEALTGKVGNEQREIANLCECEKNHACGHSTFACSS